MTALESAHGFSAFMPSVFTIKTFAAEGDVETRHAAFERWGLKRLPVYGKPRGTALVFQADVWLNLTTRARLVREATLADGDP